VAGTCEVGEPGDVVHLHRAAVLAQLARAPQEPGDDLLAGVDLPAGSAVGEDRGFAPFEGDASEPCDLGFVVSAVPNRFVAGAYPVRCLDFGPESGRHLGHRRFVLACKRFQHRGFHHPPQPFPEVLITGIGTRSRMLPSAVLRPPAPAALHL